MHKIFEHISDIVIGLVVFAVLVTAIASSTQSTVPNFFNTMVNEMQDAATGVADEALGDVSPDENESE